MPDTRSAPYHVLCALDSDLDRELLTDELESIGLPTTFEWTTGEHEFRQALVHQRFDLILLDFRDRIFGTPQAYEHALAVQPRTPVIVIVESADGAEAIALVRKGLHDLVTRNLIHRLSTVARALLTSGVSGFTTTTVHEGEERAKQILQEQLCTKLIEGLRDYAVMRLTTEGIITSWNTGCERILLYTQEEAIGKHISLLFTEEDLKLGLPERELRVARETGSSEDDRWHIRRDGSCFWASGLMTALYDENSEGERQLSGFAKVLRDLTDRKLAEESQQRLSKEIASERKRFESIISNIPGIIWEAEIVADDRTSRYSDLRLTFVSSYVKQMLGYEPEEFIGKRFGDSEDPLPRTLISPGTHTGASHRLQELIDSGGEGTAQYEIATKNGTRMWIETHTVVTRDLSEQPIGMRGVVLDITKRKEAERNLEREVLAAEEARSTAIASEKRYRHLAEAMPQIVWVADTTGQVLYYNDRWTQYTGQPAQATSGSNWSKVIHPDDVTELAQHWAASLSSGYPFEAQVRLLKHDGSYQWFLSRGIPVRDESGEITEWIGTSTNVDEQKHASESLRFLAEASEILGNSLDYEATLKSVAQLAVPKIADWCSVDIVDGEGNVQRLAVAHVNPEKVRWASEIAVRYPEDPDSKTGVMQVIRTGKPEYYPDIPWELLEAAAKDEEHKRILKEVGFTSLMVVPLTARNIVFGAMSFVSAESGRHYTDADLQLAQDLGRRAGLAIDNAWLYQKAQEEIVERSETEAALRESEERYRIVAETATDAIITIDERGTMLFVNAATEKIFGYSLQEMIGREVEMLMPDYYKQIHHAAVERYIDTEVRHIDWEGVQVPGLHKSGREIPLEISFGEFKKDGHHIFTGIVRDITERKRVEEELRTSEARFRTMIEQSPLGIQLFDMEGFCIQANRAWELLWDAKRTDLSGYNIRKDPQLAAQGLAPLIERAFQGEPVVLPPIHYDPEEIGRAGRERWVRVFLYPVQSEEKDTHEVAIIIEDITERKKAEEELRAAKDLAEANEKQLAAANQAKDRFLAILSHELRTPLTPVMATVQALREENTNEELVPWLDIIERNVDLEARLIDDLLDLTRITKGKLQLNRTTVDVHTLIHNVLDIYHGEIAEKKLELSVELEAKKHSVTGDPARLQQVFWNLVKNSVKFTPEHGKIILHSTNTIESGKEHLRIEFSDTGIGIEPTVLPRIFDAFEQGETTITRNFGGLGLGLAISKSLIDMHGGMLTAMSAGKDQGATFMVDLETSESMPEQSRVAHVARTDHGTAKPTILLIDDHIDTSTAIRMLLERQGFTVAVANSARQAIEVAKNTAFDLIVSDIGLPDESGLTLIRKLREIRSTPAIAVSGFGTEEDVARSEAAGFQKHLTKPFNLQHLRDTIRQLLTPSNT